MESVVPADIVLKTTALFTAEELEPRAGCVAVRGSEDCGRGLSRQGAAVYRSRY